MSEEEFNNWVLASVNELSQVTSRDSTKTSFWDAVTGSKFWKATWICALIMALSQMGGIVLISVYIYSMIGNILEETNGEFPITPVLGGFTLVAFSFISSLLVLIVIPRFGRKTLGIASCIGMAFFNGSAGLCLQS